MSETEACGCDLSVGMQHRDDCPLMRTMAPEPRNPYEEIARLKKTLRIVESCVAVLRGGGGTHGVRLDALGALRMAEKFDEDDWRRVAVIAGQKPPSDEAKREVLASLARMVAP